MAAAVHRWDTKPAADSSIGSTGCNTARMHVAAAGRTAGCQSVDSFLSQQLWFAGGSLDHNTTTHRMFGNLLAQMMPSTTQLQVIACMTERFMHRTVTKDQIASLRTQGRFLQHQLRLLIYVRVQMNTYLF